MPGKKKISKTGRVMRGNLIPEKVSFTQAQSIWLTKIGKKTGIGKAEALRRLVQRAIERGVPKTMMQ